MKQWGCIFPKTVAAVCFSLLAGQALAQPPPRIGVQSISTNTSHATLSLEDTVTTSTYTFLSFTSLAFMVQTPRGVRLGFTGEIPFVVSISNIDTVYFRARISSQEDFDGDTLPNLDEFSCSTDPENPDTDVDDMPDGWEVAHRLNPLLGSDGTPDFDGDRFSNLAEYQHNSNPNEADSDGDNVPDGLDVRPASSTDSEPDGLPDDWETFWFGNLDPTGTGDPDGDGLSNAKEFDQGTDPTKPDQGDLANTIALTVFLPQE